MVVVAAGVADGLVEGAGLGAGGAGGGAVRVVLVRGDDVSVVVDDGDGGAEPVGEEAVALPVFAFAEDRPARVLDVASDVGACGVLVELSA